ncbi:ADP-ribosyl cyclase/cyclic ADP-ribose hydrolase 2-like isoform X2 [Protopterus annectens]|uniref:ADP-ribosyl cyclase/cyclic ADP-ribose hydrolase 2-like isoform X2 n=1 Tax=Protopterus annectens TaxID=7888 RepID=UPI001CFA5E72|nr:ADP-ribosyl cyclase/cyclic ADP-ribose hydrolase 2-like isoform X2 [Protopterus annectens]
MKTCGRHSYWQQTSVVRQVAFTLLVFLINLLSAHTDNSSDIAKLQTEWHGPGTTLDLKEIILGRCYNYIRTINPALNYVNCTNVWEAFQNVFVNKDPCDIKKEDYSDFMELTRHPIPCGMSVFWSKTNKLVHDYARVIAHYMTLEQTLYGYLADKLKWCGKIHGEGIDYKSCPTRKQCSNNPLSSFWSQASKTFAGEACGNVTLMLNGSVGGGAFREDSLLATVEIPNLNKDNVTLVQIWVMDDVTGIDRPVHFLQCAEHPDSPSCK